MTGSGAEMWGRVRAVVVNGVLAVENGALTGAAAGRGLAKTPTAGSCP